MTTCGQLLSQASQGPAVWFSKGTAAQTMRQLLSAGPYLLPLPAVL